MIPDSNSLLSSSGAKDNIADGNDWATTSQLGKKYLTGVGSDSNSTCIASDGETYDRVREVSAG